MKNSYKMRLDRLLEKYGQKVTVCNQDGEFDVKVIIQPLRYKNKMYLDFERSEIGIKDNTCFLYIGPADVSLDQDNVRILGVGAAYRVSRSDLIYLGTKPVYVWAILNKRLKDGAYDYLQ